MSGGELQMVLIARALINDPKLHYSGRAGDRSGLPQPDPCPEHGGKWLAHEEGISAIMNTHYPTNAMSVADEALMLNRKGEFFYGPAAAIPERTEHFLFL